MFKNKQELYQIIWPLFIACLFWGSVSILVITHPRYQSKWEHNDLLKFLFGLLTLLPFLISVMLLRYMPLSSCAESSFFCNSTEHNSFHGTLILLLGCLIVWIADSGAYYGGRRFGKHKLSPKVSPNKTVEGVISGMLASFIVAVLFTQLIGLTEFNMFNLLIICVITVPVSVLGDLSESMLKRVAGIKDSGQFLPGHGGILDRIDGLSAALPIYALLYFTLVYW